MYKQPQGLFSQDRWKHLEDSPCVYMCVGPPLGGSPERKIIQSIPITPFVFREQCSGNRVPGTVFREQSSGNNRETTPPFLIVDSYLSSQTSKWTNSFYIQSGFSTRRSEVPTWLYWDDFFSIFWVFAHADIMTNLFSKAFWLLPEWWLENLTIYWLFNGSLKDLPARDLKPRLLVGGCLGWQKLILFEINHLLITLKLLIVFASIEMTKTL